MSCPGLHCPGCTGGQSAAGLVAAAVATVVAYEVCAWVAEHIWWIAGTLAVCYALSMAGCMWLERWAEVRGRRFAASRGIASLTDVEELTPAGVAWLLRRERERAAVTPVPAITLPPGTPGATIIAIERTAPS